MKACIIENTVVLPPMTSAMRMIAVPLRPGDFHKMREPNRKSCRSCSISISTVLADRLSNVLRNGFHVFMLDKLREDFFKRRQVHQIAKAADAVLGLDFTFI